MGDDGSVATRSGIAPEHTRLAPDFDLSVPHGVRAKLAPGFTT